MVEDREVVELLIREQEQGSYTSDTYNIIYSNVYDLGKAKVCKVIYKIKGTNTIVIVQGHVKGNKVEHLNYIYLGDRAIRDMYKALEDEIK